MYFMSVLMLHFKKGIVIFFLMKCQFYWIGFIKQSISTMLSYSDFITFVIVLTRWNDQHLNIFKKDYLHSEDRYIYQVFLMDSFQKLYMQRKNTPLFALLVNKMDKILSLCSLANITTFKKKFQNLRIHFKCAFGLQSGYS